MTTNGLLQIALFIAVLVALVKPLGTYMARVYEGRRLFGLDRVLGPARAADLSPVRRAPRGGDGLEGLRSRRPALQRRERASAVRVAARSGNAAAQPAEIRRRLARIPRSTPPSASRPTPTGRAYAGETTMSYLTQMLGLAVQNFVSAATGHGDPGRLHPRAGAPAQETIGNFWVDLTRTTLYILLPLSLVLALALVSQGVVQTLSPYQTVAALESGQESLDARSGRSPRRWRSSIWGPTAAASSTPTPRTRSKARRPFTDFLLILSETADRRRALLHLRQDGGGYPAGVGDPRGDADRAARLPALRLLGRGAGEPADRGAGGSADATRRQHGRQGGALRHRPLGAVRRRHHRHLQRRRRTRCTIPSRRSAAWCPCS